MISTICKSRTWTIAQLGLLILIMVSFSGTSAVNIRIVGCLNYQYMYNGSCHQCPSTCKVCVSSINCTECQTGFYGPICEKKCEDGCKGRCHMIHGHCTYGCQDGTFPADDNSCQPCPHSCQVCKTLSKCVMCEDRRLVETCQQPCADSCIKCDNSTGQCLQDAPSPHDEHAAKRGSSKLPWTPITIVLVIAVVSIVIAIVTCIFRKRYYKRKQMCPRISKDVLTTTNLNEEQPSYHETLTEERDARSASVEVNNLKMKNITEKKSEDVKETIALNTSMEGSDPFINKCAQKKNPRVNETEQQLLSETECETAHDTYTPVMGNSAPSIVNDGISKSQYIGSSKLVESKETNLIKDHPYRNNIPERVIGYQICQTLIGPKPDIPETEHDTNKGFEGSDFSSSNRTINRLAPSNKTLQFSKTSSFSDDKRANKYRVHNPSDLTSPYSNSIHDKWKDRSRTQVLINDRHSDNVHHEAENRATFHDVFNDQMQRFM